jgi:uncharacterized integral membrane protein
MDQQKYIRLSLAVLSVLFIIAFTMYFACIGAIGVFVVATEITNKIIALTSEREEQFVLILDIIIACLFGMLLFGIVAAVYGSYLAAKWNLPTINGALRAFKQKDRNLNDKAGLPPLQE